MADKLLFSDIFVVDSNNNLKSIDINQFQNAELLKSAEEVKYRYRFTKDKIADIFNTDEVCYVFFGKVDGITFIYLNDKLIVNSYFGNKDIFYRIDRNSLTPNNNIDIVVKKSSQEIWSGKFAAIPYFISESDFNLEYYGLYISNVIISIFYLLNGILFLFYYSKKLKNTEYVYYFLLCVAGTFATLLRSPFQFYLVENLGFDYFIIRKLTYISCYLLPFFILHFFKSICKSIFERFKIFTFVFNITIFILIAVVIFFPYLFLEFSLYPFYTLALITYFLIFYLIISNIKYNSNYFWIIIGFAILILAMTTEVLQKLHIINIFNRFPFFALSFVAYIYFIGIYISRQIRTAHLNLLDLSNNLEQKVEQRTLEIQKLSEQKTNMFINLAHETKTPLTLIKSSVDEYIKKVSPDEDLEILKHNVDKLARDIVNYLDAGKLERGQIFYNHNRIFNFSELLKIKVTLFNTIVKKKEILLLSRIENNIYIKADLTAVDRILNNLLDNAVKYTEKGAVITELIRKADRIILTVKDTGIGISEEHVKYIFSPYYQVSHEKRNIQGIGMGLYITKQIIDELKGEIIVESKLKEGSTFIVTLPSYSLNNDDVVIEPSEGTPPATIVNTPKMEKTEYNPGKSTILLVEDNKELVSYMYDTLKGKYNVFFAYDGKEALKELSAISKVDLIISDIMMDEMDGMQFYDEIQRFKSLKGIPFIFLTAKTTENDKIEGLKKGAIEYIYKPFSFEELLYRIESLLKIQELKRVLFIEEKYTALGKLYAGISHQILNPVTGINGHIEFIKKLLDELNVSHEEIAEAIGFIKDDSIRISNTINTLRKLSYNQATAENNINVSELITSVISLLPKDSKQNIEFMLDVDRNVHIIEDRNALTNILLNVFNNAIDATRESPKKNGLVSVSCSNIDEDFILIIEDNGVGIKEENIPLLFDIDYTTKSPEQGTGLGLYVVKELAEKMNWTITVESKPMEGTRFIFRKSANCCYSAMPFADVAL